jgi:hypothetical protein
MSFSETAINVGPVVGPVNIGVLTGGGYQISGNAPFTLVLDFQVPSEEFVSFSGASLLYGNKVFLNGVITDLVFQIGFATLDGILFRELAGSTVFDEGDLSAGSHELVLSVDPRNPIGSIPSAPGVDFSFNIAVFPVTPVPISLFTENADTVKFNALTEQQLAAVKGGADIYNALGGDDNVTLPSDAAAAALVGYSPGTEFIGGDGNDTIIGGSFSDVIDGGPGNDLIFGGGGSGQDILAGGAGTNLVDGGIGNSDSLALLAPSGVQAVIAFLGSGGDKVDRNGASVAATARFAGSRDQYTITEMTSGYVKVSNASETTYLTDVAFLDFDGAVTGVTSHLLDNSASTPLPRIPLTVSMVLAR